MLHVNYVSYTITKLQLFSSYQTIKTLCPKLIISKYFYTKILSSLNNDFIRCKIIQNVSTMYIIIMESISMYETVTKQTIPFSEIHFTQGRSAKAKVLIGKDSSNQYIAVPH